MQIQHTFGKISMAVALAGGIASKGCMGFDSTTVMPLIHSIPVSSEQTSVGGVSESSSSATAWQKAQPFQTLSRHSESRSLVTSFILFRPNGETLVSSDLTPSEVRTGTIEIAIRIWNLESGNLLQSIPIPGVFVSPPELIAQNSKLIIISPSRRRADIIDLQTLSTRHSIPMPDPVAEEVSLSGDGQTLIFGKREEQTVEVWRLDPEPHLIQTFNTNHEGESYTPDGADGRIKIPAVLFKMQLSPDGTLLATTGLDKHIKLWDVQTGELFQTLPQEHNDPIHSLAFSSDNQTLASGSSDKTVKLWDVQTGNLGQSLTGHAETIVALNFAPQGNVLVSSDMNYSVKLWNTDTGELIQTLIESPIQEGGTEVAPVFSLRGDRLAAVLPNDRIQVWRTE